MLDTLSEELREVPQVFDAPGERASPGGIREKHIHLVRKDEGDGALCWKWRPRSQPELEAP